MTNQQTYCWFLFHFFPFQYILHDTIWYALWRFLVHGDDGLDGDRPGNVTYVRGDSSHDRGKNEEANAMQGYTCRRGPSVNSTDVFSLVLSTTQYVCDEWWLGLDSRDVCLAWLATIWGRLPCMQWQHHTAGDELEHADTQIASFTSVHPTHPSKNSAARLYYYY